MSTTVRRLFDQLQPQNYQLQLTPNAKTMAFSGQVTIVATKKGRPSQRITLHQKDLTITAARLYHLTKQGEREIVLDRHNTHKRFDELRIHAAEMLYPGEYRIEIAFKGKITRPMNGLYPCFFNDQQNDNKESILLATQFESHHAREVFPCIDEPAAKATFDLTLTTPKNDVVLANTPAIKRETNGDKQTITFETTPKMSVYLLAFVIGNLQFKEAKTKSGTVVRTYATPQNTPLTAFALDVAVRCLEFYNDYFSLPYPLPKCDLIALPDFASGAMENWGCITFREQCMLVDPQNTSLPVKQYVAMVVAHELAHQWFGNLVTMRWWTDLWLNEGFASWIEYMAVDHLFPEWDMWTQFITDEQQNALHLDGLENTHPIEVAVNHPDEIRSIFDTISYSKGASVIHMLHQYLGAEDFRDGLRHYLAKHAYQNTDTTDLWEALATVSKKPVKDFMHTWTSQPGYPLLTTNVSEPKTDAKKADKLLQTTVSISQQRFYTNPTKKHHHHPVWPVPLHSNLEPNILDGVNGQWQVDIKSDSAMPWKLNRQHAGFYRVIYDHDHLQKLAKHIKAKDLGPLDRLGILADVFEATKAGYHDSVSFFELLEFYRHEDNNAVWDIIASSINTTRLIMDDEELRLALRPYINELVSQQLKRLGWKAPSGESHFDSLLRPTILSMASMAENESVVNESLKQFAAISKPSELDPDLRGVILHTAVRHGNKDTFNKLLTMHNNSTLSEERITLASALTSFKQPELIDEALGLITTDTVRLQDVSYWIAYSFMNRYAKLKTWKWLQKHWDWLNKHLGTDMSFSRLPMYAAAPFSDRDYLKEYRAFFSTVMSPHLERSFKQGIETIEWHAAWQTRDKQAVVNYFQNKASLN